MLARIGLLICVLTLCAGAAHATYLYNWVSPGIHYISSPDPLADPADGIAPIPDGADIYTGIWWAMDDTTTYFRMDLADQPIGGDADVYGIYIHDHDNSANPSLGDPRMPPEFAYPYPGPIAPWHGGGIDFFITNNLVNGFFPPELHVWNGTGYTVTGSPTNGITFNQTPNGNGTGWSLEWALSNTDPYLQPYTTDLSQQDYYFWGASLTQHLGPTTSLDIAGPGGPTPEPTTMALLGLGLGGLWLKRRRKA